LVFSPLRVKGTGHINSNRQDSNNRTIINSIHILHPEATTTSAISIAWQSIRGNKLPFFLHGLLAIPLFISLRAFHKLHQQKGVPTAKDPTVVVAGSKNSSSTDQQQEQQGGGGESIRDGLLQLSRNTDALLFFFLVFLVGLSSGATTNFAFIRMRELGASDKLLGACRLLSSLAGAPMFWFSGRIQHYMGVDRVLVVTLVCYATRFYIYVYMQNPHYGLVADVIRGISFAVFWSTATIYANRIAPPSLGVTMVRIYKCRRVYVCIKSHGILFPFVPTLF
jgi:hypothetical protein